MAVIPITLIGDNLGRRHQYLNNLVNDAFNNQVTFESIRDLPESTPVDRLFKIDLASKYRNIEYIIKCLKDQDMLYVSRALKSLWLLQESDIFTPEYLEDMVYPEMTMSAANKMKHCVALNLKKKEKCQQFYEYYREKNCNYALNFFPKCASEYIVNKLETIPFSKISPHFMKLLCENTKLAAEALIKTLKNKNIELYEGNYEKGSKSFIAKMQILLKSEPNQFFYLIENFYEPEFKRLNKRATKFILKNHRDRFEAKSELYASRFLNLATLSKFLNNVQIKELVLKLARADFLGNFHCSYKFAEPLLKRMDKMEKSGFCKKIFEDKDYGELIVEAPYFIPLYKAKPTITHTNYDYHFDTGNYRCMLKKRIMKKKYCERYTKLDKLFDQYRFKGFDKTFTDFKKLISKESNLENRQNMFLVLVSKTGGRAINLSNLIMFLTQKHANEPVSLRATIVRSLMKRACAWRMAPNDWDHLLKFGHDLGLDGSDSMMPCIEGLHGVVLHDILQNGLPSPAVLAVYLREFVPLVDYALKNDEKKRVVSCLLTVLQNDAKINVELAPKRLGQVLDTLNAYSLDLKQYPEVICTIKDAAAYNSAAHRELLERVFKLNVARQMLFNENFEIIQTDQSYINALKFNTRVLKTCKNFEILLDLNGAKHLKQFLNKLVIYFGEKDGLATSYLATAMRKANVDKPNISLARTMVLLAGSVAAQELIALLANAKVQNHKRFAAALWANIHLARPRPFIEFTVMKGESKIATANYIQICSPIVLKENLPMILVEPRLARQVLALRAPATKGLIAGTLPRAAYGRRMLGLQIALRILRHHSHAYREEDWNAVKHLIENICLMNKNSNVYLNFAQIDSIPEHYKTDYCLTMYQALERAKLGSNNGPSYNTTSSILPYLHDNLSKADKDLVFIMITNFLNNHFSTIDLVSGDYHYSNYIDNFVKIMIKFIIIIEEKNVIQNIARPFLNKLKNGWNDSDKLRECLQTFVDPITGMKQSFYYQKELMELLVEFYDEVIPLQENFEMNIKMRFTGLISQALKQIVLEEPKLFQIENVDSEDSMKFLGITFAKILNEDLDNMISKHFDSIVAIYSETLSSFLYNLKSQWKNSTFDYFKISLIKTLLEDQSKSVGQILGVLLCSLLDFENGDKSIKDLISEINDDRIKLLYSHQHCRHY